MGAMPTDRSVSALRHAPVPRTTWGLLLVGLAAAVIAGLLSMHGFSIGHQTPPGTATTHLVSAGQDAHAAPVGADHVQCPADVCGGPGAMAAMCLFVLLSLVFTLPVRGGSTWQWQPPWVTSRASDPPVPDLWPEVSLIRLCISRT